MNALMVVLAAIGLITVAIAFVGVLIFLVILISSALAEPKITSGIVVEKHTEPGGFIQPSVYLDKEWTLVIEGRDGKGDLVREEFAVDQVKWNATKKGDFYSSK